jgi:hypothetical protein
MTSPHTIERQRGAKEAGQQLAVLREKWPLAFPLQDARPLALGTVGQIAEAMGWSIPYTIGVLTYEDMTVAELLERDLEEGSPGAIMYVLDLWRDMTAIHTKN